MRILFIGDIYGEPGRKILLSNLDELKATYKPNIIIVNAENSANNGRGITFRFYKELMAAGVHVITMGNHVWGQNDLVEYIDDSRIVRPLNFPKAPGKGYDVIQYNQTTLLVINALGRTFMNANLESPFFEIDHLLETVKTDYVFVDFHAEATSEKVALGHYLDGRVDAVIGTHTHVPTADNRVLPKGTLYMTDVGMTGPLDGIIGVDKDIVVNRFLYGHSPANVVAMTKNQLNGVILDLKKKTIERIHIED
ncbi:TIGR00282 family metallophosphoesterase [Acholeplasma vituli]|uniref:TIGR00282 family metallophosphoesterase n=1 Tax=Paracholeplasma vituli TaxID=69473 RepID=A0ABT2PWR5_9MOLU|nr:TIGR00282 family metallophosphoesterase [Paracholeplasma vituli]MCU0105401.1 TIGR00282 family metallophosphoesterase [Paracholeplasma vituli]